MDQQYKDRLAIARQRNLEEAIRLTGIYSDAAKHVDEPPLITDAERAALNHKFEYHKAKRLNAAERGTQIHAEIEKAMSEKVPTSATEIRNRHLAWYRNEPYVIHGEFHAGAKLRGLIDAQNAILQETADDIRAQHNPQLDWYRDPMVTMVTPAEHKPSILKLALSLTVRFLLVLGMAVLVLAMVAK